MRRLIAIAAAADYDEAIAQEVVHELRLTAAEAPILLGGFRDSSLGERLRLSLLAGW